MKRNILNFGGQIGAAIHWKKWLPFGVLVALVMILVNSGPVAASADEQTRPTSAGPGLDSYATVELSEAIQVGITDLDELETFLDEFLKRNM